jgi:hypothetical protein
MQFDLLLCYVKKKWFVIQNKKIKNDLLSSTKKILERHKKNEWHSCVQLK